MPSDYSSVQNLIEEMTLLLKGDQELCREVAHDLNAYFDDLKAAFLLDGKSEEESEALALKALGESTQIAEQLSDPNQYRVKARSIVRMFMGRILVPLSLLVALWMGVSYAERLGLVTMLDSLEGSENVYFIKSVSFIPEENQFLLYGDLSHSTRSARERVIWENDPENKAYFANYLRLLLGDYMQKDSGISYADLEQEIRRGEALDPDNAFYNYALAAVLFKRGSEWKRDQNDKEDEWIIKDHDVLDSAITELGKASSKSSYHRYLNKTLDQRLGLFPETRRMEVRIAKLAYIADIPLPELGLMRELFRAIPYYVESNDLSESEVNRLLSAWQGFTQKAIPDVWSLIDVLVLNAIIKNAGEKTADVYQAMGQQNAARDIRHLSKMLGEPVERWKSATESQNVNDDLERLLRWKGGMLASLMLPSIGEPITEELLRPGRQTERIIAEQLFLMMVLWTFVGLMIGAWILCKVCQRGGKGGIIPLLLLPPWRVALVILGIGILLPMFLYFAYTRWSGLSSYENSLVDVRSWLELLLLTAIYLAAPAWIAVDYIRKRCQALAIPSPKPVNAIWKKGYCLAGGGVICFCCVLARKQFGSQGGLERFAVFWGFGVCLMFLIACLVISIKGWKTRRAYGLYYGTLARTLMPVYACAILFVGVVCMPYLQQRESVLLRQDTLLFIGSHGGGIEGRLTQRLKRELEAGFKAAQY